MANVTDEQIEKILNKFSDVLHLRPDINHLDGSGTFRSMGWSIIKGLNFIESSLSGAATAIYKQSSKLVNDTFFSSLHGAVQPVFFGLLALFLILIGLRMMYGKVEKRNDIVLNGLIAVMFVIGGPWLISNLGTLLSNTTSVVNSWTPSGGKITTPSNPGFTIIKNNFADLRYYANKDFNVSADVPHNSLKSSSIPYIDINDYINEDEIKTIKKKHELGAAVLTHKLVPNTSGTSVKVADTYDFKPFMIGEIEPFSERYYAYTFHFWMITFEMLIVIFAEIIAFVRIGKLFYDIAFMNIFGMLVAATDLETGQKLKKVINEIVVSFSVLAIFSLLMIIFQFYMQWVQDLKINEFVKIILMASGAWAFIDGPNIVEKTLGMDAGVRSGWGLLAAGIGAGKAIGNMAKNVANAPKNVARKAGELKEGKFGGLKDAYKEGRLSAANTNVAYNEMFGSGSSSIPDKDSVKNKNNKRNPLSNQGIGQEIKDKQSHSISPDNSKDQEMEKVLNGGKYSTEIPNNSFGNGEDGENDSGSQQVEQQKNGQEGNIDIMNVGGNIPETDIP
ncbi:pLS20_p028 family conjugation system transmembrane protein, partial [Heyndrickxia ginsengihumi]|uniref:pLS20_p028 family conjugation system transmembrane protein n=1 Tax=Heyndrickxia ginsengihumi TaxID=363870 RepID=UPI00046F74EB